MAVLLQLWATLAVLTPGYLLLLLLPALPFYSNLEHRGARDKRTGDNGENGGDPQFRHQYCDEMLGEVWSILLEADTCPPLSGPLSEHLCGQVC